MISVNGYKRVDFDFFIVIYLQVIPLSHHYY